ncbi:MAG: cupin domain-containing protein [Cyanobacteriota bacterium]|nr:cupin domain-containing protein [Cyanobacteriota bacterium]
MPIDSGELIQRYGLIPHPEGGWYRELHRSPLLVQRADGRHRSALTAILFLLQAGEISRWHRVAAADETWHFAGGDPLELFSINEPDGRLQRQLLAGPTEAAAVPLAVVASACWQAARTTGAWSLVSCCVGPGFDFADFTLLRDCPREQWPPAATEDFL